MIANEHARNSSQKTTRDSDRNGQISGGLWTDDQEPAFFLRLLLLLCIFLFPSTGERTGSNRVLTQFFVVLSYTNLYDYQDLYGLTSVFFSSLKVMYVYGLYQKTARGGAICQSCYYQNMRLSNYINRI